MKDFFGGIGLIVLLDTPVEEWRGILLKAADLIRQKGWCQMELKDNTGRLCTLNAIHGGDLDGTIALEEDFKPEVKAALKRFVETIPYRMSVFSLSTQVCYWNNYTARSKEEVIEALEACARA